MKKIIYSALAVMGLTLSSCTNLDLMPPADPAQETWYQTEEQFDMAVKDLYRSALWYWEANRLGHTDRFTDDWMHRDHVYEWMGGAVNSDTGYVGTMWTNTYKGITRCNDIIKNCELRRGILNDGIIDRFEGEARLFRACFYSYLIFLYGDVPYYEEKQTIESACQLGRVKKDEILKKIYADFDKAYKMLPEDNVSNRVRVIKATAMAFKCRTATWMLDYATAKEAGEIAIKSGKFMLDSNFERIHKASTTTSPEYILMLPRSFELEINTYNGQSFMMRNPSSQYGSEKGTATAGPSMEGMLSFLCTDGLPVDESPLYNPSRPWDNRDPRCGMTMALPESTFMGLEYNPGNEKIMDYGSGKEIKNNDSRLVNLNASWSGFVYKKGVDESWYAHSKTVAPPCIVYRYADLLLMYAEAKIELGECDDDARDAINQVRERAYNGTGLQYPKVTETDQAKLRTILRTERRMEFMWENRRWFDLIRWRIYHKLNGTWKVGLPNTKSYMKKMIQQGDWFFPKNTRPNIDEDGIVDMTPILDAAKAAGIPFVTPMKLIFPEDGRQYLLPLPTEDVSLIFGENNPGY